MSGVDDTPKIIAAETHAGRQGTMIKVAGYVPPLDGTPDEFEGFNNWIANQVSEILNKKYFGYRWRAIAEARQGFVAFQIPELMGPTLHVFIRLAEFKDLDEKLIVRLGGNLLERMNLPRGEIDMAAYLVARNNLHRFDFADVKR